MASVSQRAIVSWSNTVSENEQKEIKTSKNPVCRMILVALLLIQATLLAYLSWSTSPNRTEVGHLGAAVYLWNFGKFDVFRVNPPLVRFVAGAPIALFCNPQYDWKPYSPKPRARSEWELGKAFIEANELDDLRLYVFLARVACIPFVLLGGYVGFRFASELYGEWSGVVFLTLWTFSPLVLGWGATICPDVAAASMGIVGLHTFWHWLKTPTWGKAILAGACLGLMPLTKTTWIIAFPIWLMLWCVWLFAKRKDELRPPFRQFAVVLLLGIYMINMGYLFDGSFRQLKDYQFISGTLSGHEIVKGKAVEFGNRFGDSWVGYIPVPLPTDFVQGIDTQRRDLERGIDSYAAGTWSDHGFWWYYAYVLSYKEPLGVWCLAVIAIALSLVHRKSHALIQDEMIIVVPMLAVFILISLQTGFSVHPRYIILVLPLLYIFISRLALYCSPKRPVLLSMVTIFLLWIIASSLSFFPHSMSYFNERSGKPEEWPQYLLGSNIDWSQDLYELKTWVENHPEAKPLYITCLPSIPMEKLGIEQNGEIPTESTQGWMAISVNDLNGRNGRYVWLREEEFVEMIGFSIWIFESSSPNACIGKQL